MNAELKAANLTRAKQGRNVTAVPIVERCTVPIHACRKPRCRYTAMRWKK